MEWWVWLRPEMVCPHCQVKGKVLAKPNKNNSGVGGGKAIDGVSPVATGQSIKYNLTEAYCDNCFSEWHF